MLGEIQRQFPCIMPNIKLGHTVYDLTALRLGRAARQPHSASTPPLLWFCLGWIKKAQMEHRTWRWAGSPKMSWSRPSACGRLVRSTLVRGEHRPIHPVKQAYTGPCNDCVTWEKLLCLSQPHCFWAELLASFGALLVQELKPGSDRKENSELNKWTEVVIEYILQG